MVIPLGLFIYLFIYRANKEEKIHADMTYSDSSVVKRL